MFSKEQQISISDKVPARNFHRFQSFYTQNQELKSNQAISRELKMKILNDPYLHKLPKSNSRKRLRTITSITSFNQVQQSQKTPPLSPKNQKQLYKSQSIQMLQSYKQEMQNPYSSDKIPFHARSQSSKQNFSLPKSSQKIIRIEKQFNNLIKNIRANPVYYNPEGTRSRSKKIFEKMKDQNQFVNSYDDFRNILLNKKEVQNINVTNLLNPKDMMNFNFEAFIQLNENNTQSDISDNTNSSQKYEKQKEKLRQIVGQQRQKRSIFPQGFVNEKELFRPAKVMDDDLVRNLKTAWIEQTVPIKFQVRIEKDQFNNNIVRTLSSKEKFAHYKMLAKNLLLKLLRCKLTIAQFNAAKETVFTKAPYEREGSYMFFKAVKTNNIKVVKSILDIKKYFIYDFDHLGQTPLHIATFRGYLDLVVIFIDFGCDLEALDIAKRPAIYYAIKQNNVEILKVLIKSLASPWSCEGCDYLTMIKDPLSLEYVKKARFFWLVLKLSKAKERYNLKQNLNKYLNF